MSMGGPRFETYTLRKLAAALDCELKIDLRPKETNALAGLSRAEATARLKRLFWDLRSRKPISRCIPVWVAERVLDYGSLDDIHALREPWESRRSCAPWPKPAGYRRGHEASGVRFSTWRVSHARTNAPVAQPELLKLLEQDRSPELAGWILAGGTGLAFHLGHRVSEDLGFFRTDNMDVRTLHDVLIRHGNTNAAGIGTYVDRPDS